MQLGNLDTWTKMHFSGISAPQTFFYQKTKKLDLGDNFMLKFQGCARCATGEDCKSLNNNFKKSRKNMPVYSINFIHLSNTSKKMQFF